MYTRHYYTPARILESKNCFTNFWDWIYLEIYAGQQFQRILWLTAFTLPLMDERWCHPFHNSYKLLYEIWR